MWFLFLMTIFKSFNTFIVFIKPHACIDSIMMVCLDLLPSNITKNQKERERDNIHGWMKMKDK